MKLALVLFAVLVAACHADTNTPVIGVLTIPSNVPGYAAGNYSMIPASYLKHIESAGARIVPIPYDASPENLTFLLNQVNGVLFIGGAPNLTEIDPVTGNMRTTNLTDAGTFIFNHILEANARGEHVPITGTCLGHELLAIAISQDSNILWGNFSNINLPGRVKFASDISQSKIWSTIPQNLKDYVSETDGLYFNHNFGLSPSAFHANARLSQLMKITTTSNPIKGGPEFVSSAEGLQFPIFMNQYHPEKPAFEWKKNVNAPHSLESIEIAQYMINFFVNEARKNDRKFVSDKALEDSLIYNWVPQRKSQSFEQVYFFRTVAQDTTVWPGLFNKH